MGYSRAGAGDPLDVINYEAAYSDRLSSWYINVISDSSILKRRLVSESPETAQRIFFIFKDREVGNEFVRKYRDTDEYHHSAYFVSVELGRPIKRKPVDRVPYNDCRKSRRLDYELAESTGMNDQPCTLEEDDAVPTERTGAMKEKPDPVSP